MQIYLMFLFIGSLIVVFVLATIEGFIVGRNPFENFILWLNYLLK